ncbi:hypothetical protein D6T64_20345 [Cryobacterium melibiosiphilum]|uniref:DUF4345 domain-containing protein n=1 Tax=Cryobacterium melibiosiphilum TaxID=995039 RepID=A0A3A5MEI9_9MICO|nr:hypothetical protein [Cryobacterium melibiosiphilum]RJT85262.1 hypothetical protein D6T64_20345 [Cryobacterium melibiosiphilum]
MMNDANPGRRDPRRALRGLLLGLLYFGAVSAFGGGVLGVFVNGGGVPLDYLEGSPFTSFVGPGLILGIVVGGTQLLAAVTVQRRMPAGLLCSVAAGFGMLIWIFVELAVIREYSVLQTIYFALGGLELLAVFGLLGLVSALVPEPAPDAASRDL